MSEGSTQAAKRAERAGSGEDRRMFKKMRGVKLPYRKQGLIYFVCANYADMPFCVREKIDQTCIEAGEEYYRALRDVVIGKKSVKRAALECPCDESTLYRKRNEFYLRFAERSAEWNLNK